MGLKDIGIMTLTFQGPWRHRWRYHSICHRPFPISGYLVPCLYLKPFFRYLHLNITRSRQRPFRVTWRHRSRDHSMLWVPFPIGACCNRLSISRCFLNNGS